MLSKRLRQAISVLGSDETVEGSLREQATTYLGEPVDDKSLGYMMQTATIIYDETCKHAKDAGYSDAMVRDTALVSVLVGGMALGKRLGVEDGERFARMVSNGS